MDLILDPSDPINLDFKPFMVDDLDFQIAKKRADWITGEGSDGAALLDDPNVDVLILEIKLRVDEKADRDDAVAELRRLLAKVDDIERRRPDGMELQWLDKGSSVTTSFYALMGEFYELPMDTQGEDLGWYHKSPVIKLRLTCKPFGYGASTSRDLYDNDPFNRDTFTEGRWRVDTGSSLSVSGGQVVAGATTLERVYRPIKVADATATLKFTTGVTLTSSAVGAMAKRLDSSNYLIGEYNHATTQLRIRKVDGGVESTLGSPTTYTVVGSTSYWLRLALAGNAITLSIYTADPSTGAVAAQTATHTLAAGDATKFGSAIYGNPGFRATPGDTSHRYDDWLLSSASIRSGEPMLDFEVRATAGDVEAEPVLTVTEKSSQNRRHFEWGLEHEDYDKSAPSSPLIDSDQMTALGGAGTTRTGAYDPLAAGNSVIRATLTSAPLAICSTGNQGHIGRFRPRARVYGTSIGKIYVRLSYRVGDGPWGTNPWRLVPQGADWSDVDLGAIDIKRVSGGTQRWEGRIEAYSIRSDGTLDTLDVDYLLVTPAKRWAKARAPVVMGSPIALTARDEFNQSAGALLGKTPGAGAAWAGGGDTDDFAVEATGKTAQRTAVSDTSFGRLAWIPTTIAGAVAVQTDFKVSLLTPPGDSAVLYSVVDASNFRYVSVDWTDIGGSTGLTRVNVFSVTAGSRSLWGSLTPTFTLAINTWYTLAIAVDAVGVVNVWLVPQGTPLGLPLGRVQPPLAAPSGYTGILDYRQGATAVTRNYDNFMGWAPELGAVLYGTRSLEVTYERTERYDSTGVYLGDVPENPGSRLWLPPTGDRDLVSRIVTRARRNSVDTDPDSTITDEHEVSLASRSRYRFPRDS